jgi:hypothetical protein
MPAKQAADWGFEFSMELQRGREEKKRKGKKEKIL